MNEKDLEKEKKTHEELNPIVLTDSTAVKPPPLSVNFLLKNIVGAAPLPLEDMP
ncbi:hypothetical protein LguiB_018459 [Lonicera macranthoides]